MAGKQPTRTGKGKSVKGQANGGGRPKGSVNRVTKAVKEALRASLEAGDGAEAFFLGLKRDDPKTYAGLIGKLIPNEVIADVKTENVVKIVDLTGSKAK